ncbi:MAG TPA: hypothetical protein VNC60_05415 [Actinomycetota bacterium]|nr:hypothetical protein [Actinomycetota bacterium]
MSADDPAELLGADAAHSAVEQTREAIDEAAKVNDDPVVAEALEDASLKADQASSRVGWLRRLIHRRHGPNGDR